jgi:hypothetical protein
MAQNDLQSRIQHLSPEKKALLEKKLRETPISRRRPDDPRVLSFAQQQLWLVDQITPGTAAYNVPYPVLIRGDINIEALQNSLTAIIARHETLRTLFLNYRGQPLPVLPKQWRIDLARIDLRSIAEDKREGELWRLLKIEGATPFDLARDLKLRATLYQLKEQEYVLHHVSHHIGWDLRSKVIFYEELGRFYEAFCLGKKLSLPELPIQYADYANWQRSRFGQNRSEQLVSFWKRNLSGAPPYLEIPPDHARPAVQSLRGAKHMIKLSTDLLELVRVRSADCNVTSYMLLLSAFKILLLCYTHQEDVLVGSPFTARPPGTDGLIGVFVNTLVLRTKISLNLTFRDVMARVRETTLNAIAHQELPFEKIVEAVRPPRDLSRNALFQINFRLQGGVPVQLQLRGLETRLLRPADNDCSKFDLALELPSSADSTGFFEYSTDLFERSTIERMASNFDGLLRELIANPNVYLQQLKSVKEIQGCLGAATRAAPPAM